jgi:hypothetical protein
MLQATGLGFEVVYVNDGSADPILADAILDRQMHTAYKINLRVHAETQREVNEHHRFRVALQTPRRYAQTGGSFAPARVAGFRGIRSRTASARRCRPQHRNINRG